LRPDPEAAAVETLGQGDGADNNRGEWVMARRKSLRSLIAVIAGTVVCLLGASAGASTHHTKPKPVHHKVVAKKASVNNGNSPGSPLPLGSSVLQDGWTVKIISLAPEATEPQEMGQPSADGNNDAVPAGYVAETYTLQATNTSKTPGSAISVALPVLLAKNHLTYDVNTGDGCYANPPATPYNNTVYPGGTTPVFGACILVPTAEATGLVFVLGEQYMPGGVKYFATS
jgi:hypothetical protein